MVEGQERQQIEQVLRTLATASRSLRLYPPASPIPWQSVQAVEASLQSVFDAGAEELVLAVGREGFEYGGAPIATNIPGGSELADDFRAQGVSAIRFAVGTVADEILHLLVVLGNEPDIVRQTGGFGAALAENAVHGITVNEVQLVVMEAATPEGVVGDGTGNGVGGGLGGGVAEQLATDSGKLGDWIASTAQSGNEAGIESGLLSIATAVGPQGRSTLAASLSSAMAEQDTETRDTLLGLSMQTGPFRDLMAEVFCNQSAEDIAGSLLAGSFGRNMLALSTALTSLPLDRLDAEVRAQVHALLPTSGHTPAEAAFLDHMIEVRRNPEPEPSLAASDQTYLAVAEAAALKPEDLERARTALAASGAAIDAASVRAMLSLLDQQTEATQIASSAANLVRMVERALLGKQISLADYVVYQLGARRERLGLGDVLPAAATAESLGSLIDATIEDSGLLPASQRLMAAFGPDADATFVIEAVTRKAPGLSLAEQLLGKRMMEQLNHAALTAKFFQLPAIVARLAAEGDSRSAATIEALSRRPDAQSRREIVLALAADGGPLAQRLLPNLVADPDPEVAVLAARSLAKSGAPDAGSAIANRLSELDIDNTDFEFARELIVALARTPGRSASETLDRLASRRVLIKRGHFNEVQAAVNAALQTRTQEAVR